MSTVCKLAPNSPIETVVTNLYWGMGGNGDGSAVEVMWPLMPCAVDHQQRHPDNPRHPRHGSPLPPHS